MACGVKLYVTPSHRYSVGTFGSNAEHDKSTYEMCCLDVFLDCCSSKHHVGKIEFKHFRPVAANVIAVLAHIMIVLGYATTDYLTRIGDPSAIDSGRRLYTK